MSSTFLTLGTTPAWQRTMIFDRFTIDAVNRTANVRDYASGKSINVARVLHAMGESGTTTGFAGGPRGRLMREDLDVAGIAHDFLEVAPATRQCVTLIDRAAGTATELVEESLAVAAEDWSRLEAKVSKLLPLHRCWILTGSLPPGAPPDFYAGFLPAARKLGATVMIDARGETLRLALAHGGFIMKLNMEELAATLNLKIDSEAQLRRVLPGAVPRDGAAVVTLGAGGSLASDGQSVWRIESPRVQTVSAVGSGDAYAAGLASGLSRGLSLPEACALGSACGGANAITPLAGHLERAEAERLRAMVRVELLPSAGS